MPIYPTLPLVVAGILILLLFVDFSPHRFKVIFHPGADVNARTRMKSGWLHLEQSPPPVARIVINGTTPLSLAAADIRSITLFRLHGLGQMIRIDHVGGTLVLTVVRFQIAGLVAIINFVKTIKLEQQLSQLAARAR
jgi:hypothetical protein